MTPNASFNSLSRAGLLVALLASGMTARAHPDEPEDPLFLIGDPDACCIEFGLTDEGYAAYSRRFGSGVVFEVGRHSPADWPFVHPSHRDTWAGGKAHELTIRFESERDEDRPLFFLIGLAGAHSSQRSRVTVAVNGEALPGKIAPPGKMDLVFNPTLEGEPKTMSFALDPGTIVRGENSISIRLDEQSWILYDYLALSPSPEGLEIVPRPGPNLTGDALEGPLAETGKVVFAIRQPGRDEHWYANFSYYAADQNKVLYGEGARLCVLDLASGALETLLDDPEGSIRDPRIHYDSRRILFSYRPGGATHFHLFEIDVDGTNLRRLTDGDYDDIEPTYLPDGGIAFISSRCQRWVNCWLTQVATLHRCDADGGNIRALSSNIEHDNTPWVMPDGRILYQRWEYVDRSQVHYHHLWTMNPDGTGQMAFYGNQRPGTVMIDAKPVPDSSEIVAIFSPGHGRTEHDGAVVLVDPDAGPDDPRAARQLHGGQNFRDPFPLSGDLILVARGAELLLMNRMGETQRVFHLSDEEVAAGMQCHEPRPLRDSKREFSVYARSNESSGTGRLILAQVHDGRNMTGVEPGEIKKLLVLETLPKPINFTGGMEPLSYGGTFTLERIVGTVPVEEDGSAYLELPAMRSFLLVALDEQNLAVKRMQSFLSVQPGEVMSCVGCHEPRTQTPHTYYDLTATRRAPSRPEPIADVPEVLDFPRDIQPILDRHCVSCHGYETNEEGGPRDGGVILSGDRGPLYSHSYFALTVFRQVSDGRNLPRSNYAPRELGSSASPLMEKLDPAHFGVQLSDHERKRVRLWIEVGAPYPGTYAALGTGMIGGYERNIIQRPDLEWPETRTGREVVTRRCASCHTGPRLLPDSPSDNRGMPPWAIQYGDPKLRFSRHALYNLTAPEHSLLVLAPLAVEAGGFGICREELGDGQNRPAVVFTNTEDGDYQGLLAAVRAAANHLAEIKRFDMPGFRPRAGYLREMKRYGILPAGLKPKDPVDPYEIDRAYWKSLWYRPESR